MRHYKDSILADVHKDQQETAGMIKTFDDGTVAKYMKATKSINAGQPVFPVISEPPDYDSPVRFYKADNDASANDLNLICGFCGSDKMVETNYWFWATIRGAINFLVNESVSKQTPLTVADAGFSVVFTPYTGTGVMYGASTASVTVPVGSYAYVDVFISFPYRW